MENNFNKTLEPFLTSPFGDRFLYSINRNAFAKMCADQVYEDFLGRDYFKEEHLYLIVGTDSGVLLNYIQRKGVPEGSRIVFVDLPDVIHRLAEVVDMENLDPCIAVADPASLEDKLEEFELRKYIFADQAVLLKALCTTDVFRTEYFELYLQIKTDLQQATFNAQANLGARRFIIRQLENLAENQVSSEYLRGKFKGKTTVLLAVGPSLDEAIPWVKKHRDSLVVIAVSRAARKLYHANLPPHIVVTIDPSDASFDLSREMLHFFKDTIFLSGKHSSPPLVGQWRGQTLLVGDRLPWETPLNMPTFGFTGPTVTQLSLQAAIEMGFSRVILAGVDLCFSQEGYAYSSDVVGREKGTITGDIPGGVETNGGWMAGTLTPYLAGAHNMQEQALFAKQQGCQVINISAGAMKIEGVDYCPPEQLLIEAPETKIEKILVEYLPDNSSAERLNHYHLMETELFRARKALTAIGRLAGLALKANHNMFHATGTNNPGKHKRQMDRIEKTLSTEFGSFSRFLKRFGIMRFIRIVKPNTTEWSDERIEETARLYYEAFQNTVKEVVSLIDQTLKRLRARQMEESTGCNFNLVADQWEQDRQFGRCLVWRDRNPEAWAKLNKDDRKRFTAMEDRFQRIMDLKENLSKDTAALKVDVGEIRAKALIAFRQGQPAGLDILANNLKNQADPEAQDLEALVLGYRAELLNDHEQAFGHYQKVIDSGQPTFTEDALLRVAATTNGEKDDQIFEMALECLTSLSPIYAPKYADLLWLLGKREQALDVYADYLEKVPGDTRALLQLGKYYLDMGSKDSARVAYGFVLEQDPENKTAMMLLANLDNTP